MKTTEELFKILWGNIDALKNKEIDIKTADAIRLLAEKLVNLNMWILMVSKAADKYEPGTIDRIQSSGNRISAALDFYLRGEISKEENKEIKAAKAECNALIRELKQVKNIAAAS